MKKFKKWIFGLLLTLLIGLVIFIVLVVIEHSAIQSRSDKPMKSIIKQTP